MKAIELEWAFSRGIRFYVTDHEGSCRDLLPLEVIAFLTNPIQFQAEDHERALAQRRRAKGRQSKLPPRDAHDASEA